MKKLFLCFWLTLAMGTTHAQEVISLEGAWDFKTESSPDFNFREATFDDYVILPGDRKSVV